MFAYKQGDSCKYRHERARPLRRKLELCKFFLNKICTKGSDCIFMHGDYPCKYHHMGMTCYSGESCKFSHSALTEETKIIVERMKSERRNGVSMANLDEVQKTKDDEIPPRQDPPRKKALLGSPPDPFRNQERLNFNPMDQNVINHPMPENQFPQFNGPQSNQFNPQYNNMNPPGQRFSQGSIPPPYMNQNAENNLGEGEKKQSAIPSIFDLDVRPTASLNLQNFEKCPATPPGDADFGSEDIQHIQPQNLNQNQQQFPIEPDQPPFMNRNGPMGYGRPRFESFPSRPGLLGTAPGMPGGGIIQQNNMNQNMYYRQNSGQGPGQGPRPDYGPVDSLLGPGGGVVPLSNSPAPLGTARNILDEALSSARNESNMENHAPADPRKRSDSAQACQVSADPRINQSSTVASTPPVSVPEPVLYKPVEDFQVFSEEGDIKDYVLIEVLVEEHQRAGTLPDKFEINAESHYKDDPRIIKALKNRQDKSKFNQSTTLPELPDLNEIPKSKSLSAPSGVNIPAALLRPPSQDSVDDPPNAIHKRTLSASSDEQESKKVDDLRSYRSDPRFKKKSRKSDAKIEETLEETTIQDDDADKPPPTLSALNADSEDPSSGVKEMFQSWDPTSSPFLSCS
ncbi:DgyrCDS13274 [Dimorphilus gyrociliatus]|uniref:DgyrCDS13274 n=1 Tax=Dimorphilus gyrociliatus TaxID=2664684 RepID=A0A7I8WA74_9ANNE|nr:DgyrCDS13274 [Dimorphilus gyrociliatus]